MKKKHFDYIIVGAGSAGCVLANRLSANPNLSVLLLEAGKKDNTWKIHMPTALMYNLCNDRYNWYYHTLPQKNLNNREMYWPRGKVLGGSSSLNAMVYVRGHAKDYDRWESEGAKGWSYQSVLPYFKKAETYSGYVDEYRGNNGPLQVMPGSCNNPLYTAFIKAGVEAGFPYSKDMNGAQQEGFGHFDMTIGKGKRSSTARAYLHPVKSRKNLTIVTNAHTHQILFSGKRAIGIKYQHKNEIKDAYANAEVILSAGAINSPQLLQLSGIGNKHLLQSLNIPIIQDLPGVGQNLQDHLEIYVQQACSKPITLYRQQRQPWKTLVGIEWFLTKNGVGASSHLEAGGFVKTDEHQAHPNIQFHFLPSLVLDHGRKPINRHAYQVHVGPMRPTSKGFVQIQSNDPYQHPHIDPNYLATEQDKFEMRESIRLSREIFSQPAFAQYRDEEIAPGHHIKKDDDLDRFIREKADSAYHPSCTCKMGNDDQSVVDENLNVYGIESLRVVDASVMPSIISGNLNAATIMIAEKAADLISHKKNHMNN